MKRIAVEEHYTTEEHLDSLRRILQKNKSAGDKKPEEVYLEREAPFLSLSNEVPIVNCLLDTEKERLRAMDEAKIDIQVLSLVSPGVQVLDAAYGTLMAQKVNNFLAQSIKSHPDRFAGFAAIAPQDPEAAADELERAVYDLGFKGASINSHVKGRYLDHKKFWKIFERAAKLNVPIYIHPRSPHPDMINPFLDYTGMAASMYGFAVDVGLHCLRLICSGLFDEYPQLTIIIGHLGEALPYWLWRLDRHWPRNPLSKKLAKFPGEYFRKHFYVTTSGMFSLPPFKCCYDAIGADRILFAVDYPMESCKTAVEFLDNAPISLEDKEKIYYRNAESLLSMSA